jgi:MFS family permease
MVTWGIISMLLTWVNNVEGLYALRFLLGAAEAGFFPGAILFLSLWTPASHRSRILSVFYVFQPLTIVIGAPLASLLIGTGGLFGLAGWRIMSFGVSVPAIVIGVIAWFYLPDRPATARWLTPAERHWLESELAREHNTKPAPAEGAGSALRDRRVWVFSLIYFGLVYGLYTLTFFLPTIINGFELQFGTKFNVFEKGLVTATAYLPAALFPLLWNRDATRRSLRHWHVALPTLVGAISIPLAMRMGSPAMTVAVVAITACATFSALPSFWTLPARILSGAGAATGIALINTIGNAAGFAAPYITGAIKDATGSYDLPMLLVGSFMLQSGLLALLWSAPRHQVRLPWQQSHNFIKRNTTIPNWKDDVND